MKDSLRRENSLRMIVRIKKFINIPSIKYTCMSVLASGLNFITLIIWGRIFSIEDYGIATTLQAFVVNISTFMIPLQVMACTFLAGDPKQKDREIKSIVSIFVFVNILELFLMSIAMEKVMNFLSFNGLMQMVLFIVLVFFYNSYTLLIGFAQGEQDFILLGEAGIILYFAKMLISVLLSAFVNGPSAVVVGFMVAVIVCVALLMKTIIRLVRLPRNLYEIKIEKDIIRQYVWIVILYMIVSLYMNNGDLLLGNLYCSKVELGLYSAASGLSKISFFAIATPIATIILPQMAACQGDRRKQNGILMKAEIVTFCGSLFYGVCFWALGGWLILLIYGKAYTGAEKYILPCVIFSIVLGMFWVFYQYTLAVDLTKRFTVMTAITGALAIAYILNMKGDLRCISIVMTMAMIVAMVILVVSRFICCKNKGH